MQINANLIAMFFFSLSSYTIVYVTVALSRTVSRYAHNRALSRDYDSSILINVIGVHPCVINSVLLTLENSLPT